MFYHVNYRRCLLKASVLSRMKFVSSTAAKHPLPTVWLFSILPLKKCYVISSVHLTLNVSGNVLVASSALGWDGSLDYLAGRMVMVDLASDGHGVMVMVGHTVLEDDPVDISSHEKIEQVAIPLGKWRSALFSLLYILRMLRCANRICLDERYECRAVESGKSSRCYEQIFVSS